jgi:hypothetical protein
MQQQPQPTRFDEEAQRIQKHASMGIFMPDLIQTKEGGMDIPSKIKLAISRQYFTLYQAICAGILGSSIITLITCGVLWNEGCVNFFEPTKPTSDAPSVPGDASGLYFGVMFLCFFIANRVAHFSYTRELWCDPKVTTEERYKKAPCVTTDNCWSRDSPDTVLCKPKPPDINIVFLFLPFYWLLRYIFFFGPIIALIYFFVVFSRQSNKNVDAIQIFFAVIIGFSTGWTTGWFLS